MKCLRTCSESLCLTQTVQDGPLYILPMGINRYIKLFSIYRLLRIFLYLHISGEGKIYQVLIMWGLLILHFIVKYCIPTSRMLYNISIGEKYFYFKNEYAVNMLSLICTDRNPHR